MVEKECRQSIKVLKIDGVGEYYLNEFHYYSDKKSIIHEI